MVSSTRGLEAGIVIRFVVVVVVVAVIWMTNSVLAV